MLGLARNLWPVAAIERKGKMAWHRGEKFRCPFCGYRSNRLAWIGSDVSVLREHQVTGGRRRRGGCYSCGSKDRHRLVHAFLKGEGAFSKPPNFNSILHFAPEKSLFKALSENSIREYRRVDINPGRFPPAMGVENADILALDFEDNRFDLILCNHVLEHIDDDFKALRELNRVLKPSGVAVLQVPMSLKSKKTIEYEGISSPRERLRVYGQADHVRLYGKDYAARLQQAGFVAEVHDLAEAHSEMGLDPLEKLYVGRKRR